MVELHQLKELTGEELTDLERLRRVGREEGMEQGDELRLIRQVCRKLKKGKSIEQIADELEEEEARIQVLCDVACDFAPEYDERKILAAVMQLESV